MPGFLGSDFNAAQPSDGALVRNGASDIRNVKQRLKTFLTVLFNLENGQLKDNIVESGKLKTLTPDPQGTYREVTVNEKGQVTGGSNPSTSGVVSPFTYLYAFSAGVDPDGDAITKAGATDDDGLTVASYSFTVPADVNKILVKCIGAGGGGAYTNTTEADCCGGGGGAYIEALIDVSEGDVFLVWVGQGGTGGPDSSTAAIKGSMTKFEFNGSNYLKAPGGTPGATTGTLRALGGEPESAGYQTLREAPGGTAVLYMPGASGAGHPPNAGGFSAGSGGFQGTVASKPGIDGNNGLVIVTYFKNVS